MRGGDLIIIRITLVFIGLLITGLLSAQNVIQQSGARPTGLGNAFVAMEDSWSVFHNPAGINENSSSTVLFSFDNKFNIEGLNALSAAYIKNVRFGSVGVSAFRFGDDIYNEQAFSGVFANTFGNTSLGIRVNYLEFSSEISRTQRSFSVDFGGITRFTEELDFGASIRNINQAKLTNILSQSIPTVLNAGFSYHPTDELLINAEVEKDIEFEPGLRFGLEYAFLQKFKTRIGVLTAPFTNYFGIGFNTTRLIIDYAVTRSPYLGYSHQTSIGYTFRKK